MPPIPGFYRYHIIYFVVSVIFMWGFYPYYVYVSFGLMAGLSLIGLILLFVNQYVYSQIIALAVGLAAPIIFFAQLALFGSIVLFIILLAAGYAARDILFYP